MSEDSDAKPSPAPRSILEKALTAVRSEPRIGPHFRPDRMEIDAEGVLTIEVVVESLAQKRLALERMAKTPGVIGIVDRIRVEPAAPMSDGGVMNELRRLFATEPSFQNLQIRELRDGDFVMIRDTPEGHAGNLDLEVSEGVVTLNGMAPSLASKRLAGALAWWIPGVRDVINGMAVEPPEEDAPILIEEAVKLVLEEDPLVDADQIRVGVRNSVVRLTGLVKTFDMRRVAENDVWSVFGVDDVINEIEVRA